MRKRKEFTPTDVKNLKPKSRRYEVWEERGAGLGIRVSPLGTKSWVYTYRAGGKPRFMTLGRYPDVTVEEAHELHAKHRRDVAQGADPGATKKARVRANREAPTVEELVEDYLERYAKPKKRSWKDDARILRKEVLPPWQTRKAKDVTRRDVLELLDGIVNRGTPIMANRTFATVRRLFSWAVSRDLLTASPCVGIDRPAPERPRDRVLSSLELPKLWEALSAAPATDRVSQALLLVLITAQRPGEVLAARWSEIDLEEKLWRIPGTKTKNGIEQIVPLSPLALRILAKVRFTGVFGDPVFPDSGRQTAERKRAGMTEPRSPHRVQMSRAITRLMKEAAIEERFTAHDLRRTAATGLAALGTPAATWDRILNHKPPRLVGTYDVHAYDVEKREALDRWARRLEQLGAKRKEERA